MLENREGRRVPEVTFRTRLNNNASAEKPKSISVFTRKGCPCCAKAKAALTGKGLEFEEVVLGKDITSQSLRAIACETTVPQIFVDGDHIGDEDSLDAYLAKGQAPVPQSLTVRREEHVMKIHEYQAKEILRSYGVPVPRGGLARSADEAARVAEELGGKVVVKAQIHAGGRGKGGGVKLAEDAKEARRHADAIIGMGLITHQTAPQGQKVKQVWVEESTDIDRELYLGVVLDRAQSRLVIMASQAGGMDIEQVAAETPERILKETVDPGVGLQGFQARRLAFGLSLKGDAFKQGVLAILALYRAYEATDCSLAEINPMVVTGSGSVVALDAKMNFDDNALYRHKDILALRDTDEEAPLEVEASEHDLNYIKLDGEVGCMVNGAGLAMATMDIVKIAGSSPANFLDVGGGTNVERVRSAFRILISDPDVKAVLINIFGGIVRCDRVAEGVVQALQDLTVEIPIVVRLQGTNAEEGARILEDSNLQFRVVSELKEAAEAVVAAVREAA